MRRCFAPWKRLESWLEPERARLEALRALQVDSGNWERNAKNEGFLNHRSNRLAEARRLSEDPRYAKRLIAQDLAYLAACEAAQRIALTRARRGKVLVACLVALLALSGLAVVYREPIRQYALGQYHWRMAMGPSVLATEEEGEKAAKPGSDFAECKNGCPVMIVVPAGKFLMGSPENEPPQHEVTIEKPFAVSKFEVTFNEWDACTAAGACPRVADRWGRGQMPVINVSFDDAMAYVRWLCWLTGKEYRLLSEAEWEFAARAGAKTRYSWGDDVGKGNANCDSCGSEWDGKQTAPVGSFKPNEFGLYDMHGNVWEWVEDTPHANYEGAPRDGSAWVEGGESTTHVVRGGSWGDGDLRAAYHLVAGSTISRYDVLGFRVARTLSS